MSAAAVATLPAAEPPHRLEKKPVKFSNLLLGAGLNLFEVTTLGQPLEVVKTTMAANRSDGMAAALGRVWNRGGVFGCKFPRRNNSLVPLNMSRVLTFGAFFCASLNSLSGSYPVGLD